MSDDIKRMNIAEFRALGFLQEANRQLVVDDDGTERLGGIWDYREDPEGIVYDESVLDDAKVETVAAERRRHLVAREALFDGEYIQPV